MLGEKKRDLMFFSSTFVIYKCVFIYMIKSSFKYPYHLISLFDNVTDVHIEIKFIT